MWWRPLGPIGARGAALWWMVCVREDGVRAKSVRDHLQTRAHNTRSMVCVERYAHLQAIFSCMYTWPDPLLACGSARQPAIRS